MLAIDENIVPKHNKEKEGMLEQWEWKRRGGADVIQVDGMLLFAELYVRSQFFLCDLAW